MRRVFKIEPFKHRVEVDPEYPEKTWRVLEHAIDKIYNNNDRGLSFQDLYRDAYHMVLHEHGEKLYSGLVDTMTRHLKEISELIEAAHEDLFLEELDRKWNNHNKALQKIREIFVYMDMSYVPNNRETSVRELGLNLWRDNVIHSGTIQDRLQDALVDLVGRERTGEVINRGLMRDVTKMLMELGPSEYQENFEKPFLEASSRFYGCESLRLIERCECGEYLREAENRLIKERERVSHYLDTEIESKITYVLEDELISSHMQALVYKRNSGLVNMLLNDNYRDLSLMYNMFCRVHKGLPIMRDAMSSHIRESGKQFVSNSKSSDPVDFVRRILNEKDKYDRIISILFDNELIFQIALNSSFKYFINLNNRCPEFISLYIDDKLRKGLKGGVGKEDDLEIVLDKAMVLFRYLKEKDIFEEHYRKHLANRLLDGETASSADDTERSMIVKLKTVCGSPYTHKLEGMLEDLKTSKDTMLGFCSCQPPEDIKDGLPVLDVQVLTSGFWPTAPTVECNLPSEILGLRDRFQAYYLAAHTGRRLSWQTNMGTADLRATFGGMNKYELNVSTYQMCVLMLFNSEGRMSYKEIEEATGIPGPDLKRCLHSLACVEGTNVLSKDPMSTDIKDSALFYVNDNFTSNLIKVKIGTVAEGRQQEEEKQQEESRERVEEARKPHIEAAVVRIMKSWRVLYHTDLVAEVTKQLQSRFILNVKVIKERIESLIEREFLERDEADGNLYRYVA